MVLVRSAPPSARVGLLTEFHNREVGVALSNWVTGVWELSHDLPVAVIELPSPAARGIFAS